MVNEFHLSRSAMKVHEWGFVLWLIDLTSINKKRTKILQTRKYANKTKIIIKFGQGWASLGLIFYLMTIRGGYGFHSEDFVWKE